MKCVKDIKTEDLEKFTEELIGKYHVSFEGMKSRVVRAFILDGQYMGMAMEADICTSEVDKHVWSVRQFKDVICDSCLESCLEGLLCLKCLVRVHFVCYSTVSSCTCQYYENRVGNSPIQHQWSNVIIDGTCDKCLKEFNRFSEGRVCRWCLTKMHLDCRLETDECYLSGFKHFLYPFSENITEALSINNRVPILVFMDTYALKGHGRNLMCSFLEILHPMQVVNIRVTDPAVAFYRFWAANHFMVMIIGGDRMCSYIMKTYQSISHILMNEPKFRFIPMSPLAEIGRAFGGRIKYSERSAEYLLKQIRRLVTFSVGLWTVEDPVERPGLIPFTETFINSLAINLVSATGSTETFEIFETEQVEPPKRKKRSIFTCCFSGERDPPHYDTYNPLGVGFEPKVDEYIDYLEFDGKEVKLERGKYVSLVFVSQIVRGDDTDCRERISYNVGEKLTIYGMTEYFRLNKPNLERNGIKMGEASRIRFHLTKACPFLADGYTNIIGIPRPRQGRLITISRASPIQVLATPENYTEEDGDLTPKGQRELEDEPIDTTELFLKKFEREQREVRIVVDDETKEVMKQEKHKYRGKIAKLARRCLPRLEELTPPLLTRRR